MNCVFATPGFSLCAALCLVVGLASSPARAADSTAKGGVEAQPLLSPLSGAAPHRVLVMDIQVVGLDASVGTTVTQLLAEQLGRRAELKVSTLADLKESLSHEQSKQLLGCQGESACMADLQRFTEAEYALSGSVGAIGKQVVLNLSLIDVAASRPLGRVGETLESLDKIAEAAPGLLGQLFGWQGVARGPRFSLPEGKSLSFAVMDLRPTGIDADLAENLTQVLGTEIKRVEGTKVISRDDIAAMLQLEQTKQLLDCDDTSCIAELGGALGVDKLVVGQVGKMNQSYVISLRLIDPSEVNVDNRVTETYRGEADQLIGAVRQAGRQLLGVGLDATGKLAAAASEEQAEVFVDGNSAGTLPLPPLEGIPAGRHTVRLSKDGFYDVQTDVYVNPGEATVVWGQLEKRPTPWYQTWWFWTLSGGAVLAAGTAVGVVVALPGDVPDTATGSVTLRGAP